jgi:hypothetical protein
MPPPAERVWLDRAAAGPAGRKRAAVRQQLSGVVEEDDAIAQQAPALFWVSGHGAGSVTVGSGGCGAPGKVMARRRPDAG